MRETLGGMNDWPAITTLRPLPGESLEGLLERLRRVNGYAEANWLTYLLDAPPDLRVLVLRERRHYARLSTFSTLDNDDLAALTLHHVAPAFYLPEEVAALADDPGDIAGPLWEDGRLLVYGLGQNRKMARKICPACWSEHRTVFLAWSLRHVTTCPIHDVLLVDRCSCGRPLRFALGRGLCASCGADVGQLPATSLGGHAESSAVASLVASAAGLGPVPFPDPRLELPSEHLLRGMHPAAFFRFLNYGYQLLVRRYPDDPLFASVTLPSGIPAGRPAGILHYADVAAVHRAVLVMWRLLADWPGEWHALLARIAAREERDGVAQEYHFPSYLFNEAELRGPAFGWLHRSWGRFVFENLGRSPGVWRWYRFYESVRTRLDDGGPSLPALLSQPEARARIGAGMPAYKQYLAGAGDAVRGGHEEVPGRPWQLLDEERVEELQQRHAARLNWPEAEAHLGVGKVALHELVAADLIPVEERPDPGTRHGWIFLVGALDAALAGLVGHLPLVGVGATDDSLTLDGALAAVRSAGIGLPELLGDMRDGALVAMRAGDTARLADLRFRRDDVLAYRAARGPALSATARYSSLEVCQLVGCTQSTLRSWQDAGLLLPDETVVDADGAHPRYDGTTLVAFQARHMGTEEALELLGCTRPTLYNWVAAGGRLAPAVVAGGGHNAWLFDRAALCALVADQVGAVEAAALLGTDVRTFNGWVAQGFLRPIVSDALKARWYRRDAVLRARDALLRNPRTGKPRVDQGQRQANTDREEG
jgi:predicted DNA-binding transcriptional regulator AlpA